MQFPGSDPRVIALVELPEDTECPPDFSLAPDEERCEDIVVMAGVHHA